METEIANLVMPSAYCAQRQHIFQSKTSFDWFIRRHRAALIGEGAMLMLTGRWFLKPEAFDAFLLKLGQRSAQSHARQSA